MTSLIDQINRLPSATAMEAARFVAMEVSGDIEPGDEVVLAPIKKNPDKHYSDVAEMAKSVLVTAAMIPEYEHIVRDAIGSTGKKNIVLGGTEIIALSAILYMTIRTLLGRGKSKTKRTIRKPDGTVMTEETVYDTNNNFLSEVFKNLFK